MDLCFMTFSCPDYELDKVLATAIRYGYDGVEPRAQAEHKHGVEVATTKKERARIKAQFADAGIKMSCIATSCRYALADEKDRQEMVETTRQHIELAADCGSPTLRVFGGSTPEGMNFADSKKYVAESLAAVADFARDHNVYVCLETHDAYSKGADAGYVVAQVNQPNICVNWDVMHCIRQGETVDEAFEHVKNHVKHVHVHDGTFDEDGGGLELCLMGEGQVPYDEAIKLLATIGYDGALSGEWIGGPALDEILPHDAAKLREYIAAAGA